MTHIEDSVEAKTFVDHDETDVEEKKKVDLQLTGEENTSEPTEDAEKLCTFDIKEIEGKGDEWKSEDANVAQDKQGAGYETKRPTLSEIKGEKDNCKRIWVKS